MSLMKKQEVAVKKASRMEVTPPSRVQESPESFTLTLELPGVAEGDAELTLEHRTLTVTAENTVGSYTDCTPSLTEIPEVRYRAVFELPEQVATENIRAAQRNGLLVLTLPKREEVKPRKIAITAG